MGGSCTPTPFLLQLFPCITTSLSVTATTAVHRPLPDCVLPAISTCISTSLPSCLTDLINASSTLINVHALENVRGSCGAIQKKATPFPVVLLFPDVIKMYLSSSSPARSTCALPIVAWSGPLACSTLSSGRALRSSCQFSTTSPRSLLQF